MALRATPQSLPSPSPETPTGPGPLFSAVVGLLTVLGPLTLLGSVLCVDRNIQTYAGDYAGRFVFRAALKQDVSSSEADQLALTWRKSALWRSARVIPPQEDFAQIPELKDWLANPQNRTIAASMPHSVVLVPADALRSQPQPSYLESALTASPEVDQVFYDRAGLAWVRRTMRAWNAAGTTLAVFFAVLAVAMSVVAGWLAERLCRLEADKPPARPSALRNRPGLVVLLASSGALAVMLLYLVFALVRFLSDLAILFLSFSQGLALVVLGACLGCLAVWFRYWIGRRLGRMLLPLLTGAALLCGPVQAETPADSTDDTSLLAYRPAVPALKTDPVSELDAASDLSSLSPEERQALIAEKTRLYDYLDDWRRNTLKGQDLDRQNRNVVASKLDAARRDRERIEESVARRFDKAARLTEGVRLAQPESAPLFVNSVGQARRDHAAYLLARSAHQSFFMLDVERERLKETRGEIDRLEGQLRGLDRVAGRYGNQSPDGIEKEKRRVADEIVMLIDQNRLLNNAPQRLSGENGDAADNAVFAAAGSSSPPGAPTASRRNGQDGGYYLLAERGTLIHAAVGGKVLYASYFAGLGNTVILDHGEGYSSVYAFLEDVVVRPDQEIEAGAYLGSAGIIKRLDKGGIRFEVRKNGKRTRAGELAPLAGADLRRLVFGPARQNPEP